MATVLYRPTNGVSFGVQDYVVTTADGVAGTITFDFQVDYALAGIVRVVGATNINVALSDAVITYPALGQITIANGGSTFTLTAGKKISVVAQRAGVVQTTAFSA